MLKPKSVARLKEVCLMFDALNMTLDKAIASPERDVRYNPHNIRRREQAWLNIEQVAKVLKLPLELVKAEIKQSNIN